MTALPQSLPPLSLIRHANEIAEIRFDRPESQANIFDEPTLQALDRALGELLNKPARGLIISSAKPRIFIAGADLNALRSADEVAMHRLIQMGQEVFEKLHSLHFPTVAAIHGACLGGGFELALACDWRVASSDKATKIGLPETQLGILPAWGGSTRLPRLIGLPKALDLILAGKQVAPKHGQKLGLVDRVVPKETLHLMGERLIEKGKPSRPRHWLVNNRLSAWLLRKRLKPRLESKTRGHYPAIPAALDVATRGICLSVRESLLLERDAIASLAKSPAAENLMRVFLLQERAKKLAVPNSVPEAKPAAISRVAVIGAGVMGAGIAQWLAARGLNVLLGDLNAEALGRGMGTVDKLIAEGMRRRIMTPLEARRCRDRIVPVAGAVPLHRVELVIEAAVEKLEIKRAIFRDLEQRCAASTILATNTSALPLAEIGSEMSHPERLLGLHFFNPVHKMQLVELVRGPHTSPEALTRALGLITSIGKLPVIVEDRPGFLVNRILMPYLVEAGALFEQGAEAKWLDDVMLDFGMPMGPLRLIDEIGLDVALHVANSLHAALGDRLKPPALLVRMKEQGLLGRKAGAGFYTYHKGREEPNPVACGLRGILTATEQDPLAVRDRLLSLAINEAARCLEEGVARSPEDVDFAMIMGTGWAPFRGGLLRYADAEGPAKIMAILESLARNDPRFRPCDYLAGLARSGGTFHAAALSSSP